MSIRNLVGYVPRNKPLPSPGPRYPRIVRSETWLLKPLDFSRGRRPRSL